MSYHMVSRAPNVVRSVSRALLDREAGTYRGRVVSLSSRACNVADAAGNVTALVSPSVGNGPFSVVMVGLGEVKLGAAVSMGGRTLAIGRARFALDSATRWDPRVQSWQEGVSNALMRRCRVHVLEAAKPTDVFWDRRLDGPARALASALQFGGDVVASVDGLVGLGPGLTPAGDDYLVGALACIRMLGWQSGLEHVVALRAGRTTALSSAFLIAATNGDFAEPWHELSSALCMGQPDDLDRALNRLTSVGATSGRYAVLGFLRTLLAARVVSGGRTAHLHSR